MAEIALPETLGVEEEYLLVDPATRDLPADPPGEVIEACAARVDAAVGEVKPEFLRAQVEVGTTICRSIGEAAAKLATLRRAVADAAAEFGLVPIAASTHPFAHWRAQPHTDKERYNLLVRDLQGVADRLLICGMHVHVGIADAELRNDVINQASYFLPHLLALSASSPFWQGRDTGLASYRLAVWDELPRTGLPERFDSYGEYCRHLDTMMAAGLIDDATKIWWDIRAHANFPTLELRITDICTNLADGVTVAALYLCILSALVRLRRANQRWREYSNMLIEENRWRAQRYGTTAGLVDFGRGEIVPYADLLDELIELVREDAALHGCRAEVARAREIVARGTSAARQCAVHTAARADGADPHEALCAVVDWLIDETLAGIAPA